MSWEGRGGGKRRRGRVRWGGKEGGRDGGGMEGGRKGEMG